MSSRDCTNPNGDQPCEEECFDFMWPRISNITADDNLFNGGSIQEDTSISKESIERRETPSIDVQILGIGGNVNTRLSTGGHDMVPTTTVPVSRIFDRFRNMRLNSLGSDYMSHADNRYRAGDQQIRTRTLENADCNNTQRCNTSSLDGRKYSSLALEDLSLDHLETKLYD
ncbi:hypothetical protein Tco_0978157 [Tanacetum coccineum]|uniref:Uncharacterized protein n=1 Tax=Tanacetum coccineum TaxID=301880 RepID=A0ABQ5EM81_9ASTR